VPEAESVAAEGEETPCVKATVLAMVGSETFEVTTGTEHESVHIACLDAPETRHRFAELGWFGRATLSAMQTEVRQGDEVCLSEHSPPQRDLEGHRIVYVTLADGKDYAAGVIGSGLGLLRPGPCGRAVAYRTLEDRAIAQGRGLWGPRAERAAFAAAGNSIAIGAGGGGAPPPRRVGGG
jgi:endonuclease YncB( thermonuclease family)